MIVTCPACSSRYRIREEKIQGRGARITCPSCGHKFVVEREAAASGSSGAISRPRSAPRTFDEDDEADVPTTVMPHGSQLATTMRAAAEAKARAAAASGAPAPVVGAPSSSVPSLADLRAASPAASGPPAAVARPGGSRVVLVALVLVAVVLVGLAIAGFVSGGM